MDNRSAQPKVKLGNGELEQAKDKRTIAVKTGKLWKLPLMFFRFQKYI
jgi:hypothetical protein